MSAVASERHPFDGPRDFTPYITPSGRRLTEYEALVLFTQPIETGHEHPVSKRAGWPPESTRVRSSNWYAFRDPAQMWQRPYVKRQAEQERSIERAMAAAHASGALERMSGAWWEDGFHALYLPMAFFEHGLFRALNFASLGALSDSVSYALSFDAVDKERHAQDIVFLHHDLLASGVGGLSDDPGLDAWMTSPELQPLRQLVERLMATNDWCEVALATNLVIEPLLERFVCNEILQPSAMAAGDLTVIWLLSEAESDRQRNTTCFTALAQMLLGDEQHGDLNRRVINEWIETWSARTLSALDALQPLIESLGRDATQARSTITASWHTELPDIRPSVP